MSSNTGADESSGAKLAAARIGFWTAVVSLAATVLDKYSGVITRLLVKAPFSRPPGKILSPGGLPAVPRAYTAPVADAVATNPPGAVHIVIIVLCVLVAAGSFLAVRRLGKKRDS
ncbi:MAG: hypothetical protein JW909_02565 [Planctomycetes bacterium]|nr:hypothetical protein [Planctomycetota bacterium]